VTRGSPDGGDADFKALQEKQSREGDDRGQSGPEKSVSDKMGERRWWYAWCGVGGDVGTLEEGCDLAICKGEWLRVRQSMRELTKRAHRTEVPSYP
jgi:hypothetical protein